MNNLYVEIEGITDRVKFLKETAIQNQKFEDAANLRDLEKQLKGVLVYLRIYKDL